MFWVASGERDRCLVHGCACLRFFLGGGGGGSCDLPFPSAEKENCQQRGDPPGGIEGVGGRGGGGVKIKAPLCASRPERDTNLFAQVSSDCMPESNRQ